MKTGMDTERVNALAGQLQAQADLINGLVGVVDAAVGALSGLWFGENFGVFHQSWVTGQRSQANTAALDISGVVTALRRQIAEQVGASQANGSSVAGAVAGPSTLINGVPASALAASLVAMTPAARAAFFSKLTPAQQKELALAEPDVVGNLNGVPLAARAEANQERALADLRAADQSGDTQKAAMIRSLLGMDKHGTIHDSVLLYDPQHDYYASMIGNINTAKHVAIFVPGVHIDGTDSAVPGMMGYATSIQAAAGPDTAVIMWKGYSNPGDNGGLSDVVGQAPLSDHAVEGGQNLAAFTNDGLPPLAGRTLNMVAHSYGSVVLGEALADDGLHPTNVVVLGSPGMNVRSVDGLHLNSNQFYSERAPGDYVANGLGGFDKDPAAPDFGGTRLATNAPGNTHTVSGHSDYFGADTQSLKGIVDVIHGGPSSTDLQQQSAGDYVHAGVTDVLNYSPGTLLSDGVTNLVDQAAQNYDGPGSGFAHLVDDGVQLQNHIEHGVQNAVGAGAGYLTDKTVEGVTYVGQKLDEGVNDLKAGASDLVDGLGNLLD